MRINLISGCIAALLACVLLPGCCTSDKSCCCSEFEIDSAWQIVCPADAVPTERKAAGDTAKYIRKVTGLDLKIVQTPAAGRPAIIVRKNTELPEEAWEVRRIPEGLLISGGIPNGILYACGEFLEHGLGCRFLAYDATYIPRKEKLILPEDFKLIGKPFFAGRSIYRGPVRGTTEFYVRSKQNGGLYAGPEWGWYDRCVEDRNCHTYYLYSSRFPADKPEWLSLHTNGERLRGIRASGPGQLCLTQPDSRDFIFREMVARIERERETLKKKGRPFSRIIDLSSNDNNWMCVCPGCRAAAEKYGGYTGVMLEFTNDLAQRLEKVFPEMMIQTFAYEHTEEAPAEGTIAPRKNVMIHLAQLGGEYHTVTKVHRDSVRPLTTHPNNRLALQKFKEWSKFGTPIKMWDYWVLYDQRRNFPYTAVPVIAPNLRFYAENHVSRVFAESELIFGKRLLIGRCFADLTYYLGAKLMVDPFADDKAIIADFMKHYYGPAAQPMSELLTYLCSAMKKERVNLGKVGIGASYLTAEFFADTEKLLSRAEELAKDDPAVLARIGEERIWFDEAALDLQSKLDLPFDREKILERYRANYRKLFQRIANPAFAEKNGKKVEEHLDLMGKQVPIPEQFAGKRIYDFPVFTMLNQTTMYAKIMDDPEAAGGKASFLFAPEKNGEPDKAFHAKDLQGGVYSFMLKKGFLSKTFSRDEMFKDEKYHWYCLGKTRLVSDSQIWFHWSWRIGFKCLSSVYSNLEPDAQYSVWVSAKLQGPSYSPGSKKEDAVAVDRIIVIKE